MDEMATQMQATDIDQKIAKAQEEGVLLNDQDIAEIRTRQAAADELLKRYRSHSVGDPMSKGDAFPMGVGFTRMTKRKEQRLDASVRRAGEAVELYKRYETAQGQADRLLRGEGTQADRQAKAGAKSKSQRNIIEKLLSIQPGSKTPTLIGPFEVLRVNKDRDGYPSSFTYTGPGVIKGVGDKIGIAKAFFGGSEDDLRAVVDEVKEALAQAHEDKDAPRRERQRA